MLPSTMYVEFVIMLVKYTIIIHSSKANVAKH